MNKFFNALIAITLIISVMAFGREGSFSGGGYDYSSSYSPSYSSDWGSSSSFSTSSSDWSSSSGWSFSSDDDDYSHQYHHNHHYHYPQNNTRVHVYTPPTYYLYELYNVKYSVAKFYVNECKDCTPEDKVIWKELTSTQYTKGSQPEMSDKVKEFIKHVNAHEDAYDKKCEEDFIFAMKIFFGIFVIPFATLLTLITNYSSHKN